MGETTDGLATYVRDVLAFEERIRASLSAHPETRKMLQSALPSCERHIAELEKALENTPGGGNIDSRINEIREDYAALSYCIVSYDLLLAAAHACGNREIAALAQQHLHDYAKAVVEIADALPALVSNDARAGAQTRNAIREAWRTSSETTTGTIESEAALNRAVSKSTYPTV